MDSITLPKTGTRFQLKNKLINNDIIFEIYSVRPEPNSKIYYWDINNNEKQFNYYPNEFQNLLDKNLITVIPQINFLTDISGNNPKINLKSYCNISKESKFLLSIPIPNIQGNYDVLTTNKLAENLADKIYNDPDFFNGNINFSNKNILSELLNKYNLNHLNSKQKVMEQKNDEIKINYQAVKGNLKDKPEIKTLESGKKVAEFTIRQSYPVGTPKEGEKQEYINNYHNAIAFGEKADAIEKANFEKGDFIEVEGKSNFYSYEKEGVEGKNYANKILVNNAQKLDQGVKPFQGKNNHIELKGNLTKDVEFVSLNGGKEVANISIAHNYKHKEEEKVMYINASIFNEKAIDYLKNNDVQKGSTVAIKGSVEPQSYQDKNQNTRYTVKVNSNFITLNKSTEQVVDNDNVQDQEAHTEISKSPEQSNETSQKKKMNNGMTP